MLKELRRARRRLQTSLERYSQVCSNIHDACLRGSILRDLHSDHAEEIDRELQSICAYEQIIQRAKLAIKLTRNHAFSITPINRLPPEILTYIFHLARDFKPSCVDRLTAVCSRWRSILLNTCSLWTYIDYLPTEYNWRHPELLDRAFLHVSRSGQLPLELHISAASDVYNIYSSDSPVDSLSLEVAPRIRTLVLDFEHFYLQRTFDLSTHSVFSSLLSRCVPGMLTKLVTEDNVFGFFSTGRDAPEDPDVCLLRLEMQHSQLENLFSPITVLHLTGLFPQWTSSAYHGLVDLRLCASPETGYSHEENVIKESQLVSVLASSPWRRVFHFELQITRRISGNHLVPRTSLPHLEELYVHFGSFNRQGSHFEDLLRLLEPGSKPLHLAIVHDGPPEDERSSADTKAFFSRSNVIKFYATRLPRLLEVIPSLPYLKVLILVGYWDQSSFHPPTEHGITRSLTTHPQLDVCFALGCTVPLDGFVAIAQSCRAQSVVIFKSRFYGSKFEEKIDIEIAERELSAFCQYVKTTNVRPNLTDHRELFWTMIQ